MYEVAFSVLFLPFFFFFWANCKLWYWWYKLLQLRRADKSLLYNINCRRRTKNDRHKMLQMPTHNCYYNQSTDIIHIYYTSRLKEMGLIFSVLLSTLRPNTNKTYATRRILLENPILLLYLHCWSNGIVLHLTIPYYSYFNVFVQYCISHFIRILQRRYWIYSFFAVLWNVICDSFYIDT